MKVPRGERDPSHSVRLTVQAPSSMRGSPIPDPRHGRQGEASGRGRGGRLVCPFTSDGHLSAKSLFLCWGTTSEPDRTTGRAGGEHTQGNATDAIV